MHIFEYEDVRVRVFSSPYGSEIWLLDGDDEVEGMEPLYVSDFTHPHTAFDCWTYELDDLYAMC